MTSLAVIAIGCAGLPLAVERGNCFRTIGFAISQCKLGERRGQANETAQEISARLKHPQFGSYPKSVGSVSPRVDLDRAGFHAWRLLVLDFLRRKSRLPSRIAAMFSREGQV